MINLNKKCTGFISPDDNQYVCHNSEIISFVMQYFQEFNLYLAGLDHACFQA